MTEDQPCTDIKACPRCQQPQLEEGMTTNADLVLQGSIPLVIVHHRCLLCGHEWDEAHEPSHRPTLEEGPSPTIGGCEITALIEFPLRLFALEGLAGQKHRNESPEVGDTVLVEQWLAEEGFSARECRVLAVAGKKIELEQVAAHFPQPRGTVQTVVGNGHRWTCRASHFETPFEERFRGMLGVITTMLEYYPQSNTSGEPHP